MKKPEPHIQPDWNVNRVRPHTADQEPGPAEESETLVISSRQIFLLLWFCGSVGRTGLISQSFTRVGCSLDGLFCV